MLRRAVQARDSSESPLCQAARPADRAGGSPPACRACSLGPAEPAYFTFFIRACFPPRDQSSLAFRLHIFLCHELPLPSPSLTLREGHKYAADAAAALRAEVCSRGSLLFSSSFLCPPFPRSCHPFWLGSSSFFLLCYCLSYSLPASSFLSSPPPFLLALPPLLVGLFSSCFDPSFPTVASPVLHPGPFLFWSPVTSMLRPSLGKERHQSQV